MTQNGALKKEQMTKEHAVNNKTVRKNLISHGKQAEN
jgi:hypothetical protein